MKKLISEINRFKQLFGIQLNEDDKPTEQYESEIADILKEYNIYTKNIESLLYDIMDMGFNQTINFDLLERNVRNVLMKKGNKEKNITKYFENIINALKNRKIEDFTSNEPDFEEFSFEPQEPSLIKKKVYNQELYNLQVELLKMQEWVKNTGKTVIIVFEGRDSAGKGSTIKKFTENLNPRYYNIIALGVPTPEERKAWWDRYRSQIKKGMINFFDRSWYNRGLVEPVMGYGSPEEYEDFMDNVEDFEKDLVKDGDYLFKLWFSIDKETQASRFQMRQASPLKYWKYSPNDEKMQDMWERFTEFKQKLFDKTSTVNHPWVILDANDKRVSGLNAIRYVLQNIPYKGKNREVLDKEFPEAMTVLKPEVNEQSMGGFLSPDTVSKNLIQTSSKTEKKPKPPIKTDSSLKSQTQSALNELKKYGYSKELASAIVANMRFESGINPGKINPNDRGAVSYGLIQWRGGDVTYKNGNLKPVKSEKPSRLKKLLQLPKFYTMPVQINFLHNELNSNYKNGFNTVKKGKTPYEMGKLFDEKIEQSQGLSREERGQYAQKIYDDINNGHFNYV